MFVCLFVCFVKNKSVNGNNFRIITNRCSNWGIVAILNFSSISFLASFPRTKLYHYKCFLHKKKVCHWSLCSSTLCKPWEHSWGWTSFRVSELSILAANSWTSRTGILWCVHSVHNKSRFLILQLRYRFLENQESHMSFVHLTHQMFIILQSSTSFKHISLVWQEN